MFLSLAFAPSCRHAVDRLLSHKSVQRLSEHTVSFNITHIHYTCLHCLPTSLFSTVCTKTTRLLRTRLFILLMSPISNWKKRREVKESPRSISALTCSVWLQCDSKFYTVWDTNWPSELWLFLQYNLIKRHCQ